MSWRLPKLVSRESVLPSNLCRPLLLLPSIFPSIRAFSNESAFQIRWPKYWSFSFNISPSNEYSGLISFRINWLSLLAVQGTLKSLLQHHNWKVSILQWSAFFMVHLLHPYLTTGKIIALTIWIFVGKVTSLLFNTLSRFIYIIQKSCIYIYIHIVSLCLPMDFKPVFVAGTPAKHRAAQSSFGKWKQEQEAGGPVSSFVLPWQDLWQKPWSVSCQNFSFSWMAPLEWQDFTRKTIVAINFWSQNTHLWRYMLICCCLVTKSCPIRVTPWTVAPDSSVLGILQARILQWVDISFSRVSSPPRDWICVSCTGRQILY